MRSENILVAERNSPRIKTSVGTSPRSSEDAVRLDGARRQHAAAYGAPQVKPQLINLIETLFIQEQNYGPKRPGAPGSPRTSICLCVQISLDRFERRRHLMNLDSWTSLLVSCFLPGFLGLPFVESNALIPLFPYEDRWTTTGRMIL